MRPLEGSLVAERALLPPCPDVDRGEDTPVIAQLQSDNQLAMIDRPDLYIYVYHGKNSCDRQHWEANLLRFSTALPENASRQVRILLHESPD
jgi:hypothetical protein